MEGAGRVFQLNVSEGGVPKRRVDSANVTTLGLSGDRQRDLRVHGGPDRAVCLFAIEQIAIMRMEGHRLGAGATGENITTEGIEWELVAPGVILHLGQSAVLEVTSYADACWKNAQWFTDGNVQRIDQVTHPGSSRVYARVLAEGAVREFDSIRAEFGDAIDRVVRRQVRSFRWPRDFQH